MLFLEKRKRARHSCFDHAINKQPKKHDQVRLIQLPTPTCNTYAFQDSRNPSSCCPPLTTPSPYDSSTWHCFSQTSHSMDTVYVSHVGPRITLTLTLLLTAGFSPPASEPPGCCFVRPFRLQPPSALRNSAPANPRTYTTNRSFIPSTLQQPILTLFIVENGISEENETVLFWTGCKRYHESVFALQNVVILATGFDRTKKTKPIFAVSGNGGHKKTPCIGKVPPLQVPSFSRPIWPISFLLMPSIAVNTYLRCSCIKLDT